MALHPSEFICVFTKKVTVLYTASRSQWADFEDAVLHASAQLNGIDAIITRDISGFKKSQIKVYTPKEFLMLFQN